MAMPSYAVVVDTDMGPDDAIALLAALASDRVDVVGVCTVTGCLDAVSAAQSALRILGYARRLDIPVCVGCRRPLYGPPPSPAEDAVAKAGLSIPREAEPDRRHAAQFIVEAAREHPGDLTLLTMGPLTNVAVALMLDEELPDRLRVSVSMLGCYGVTPYGVGNVASRLEFNAYSDPLAAKVYLLSGLDKRLIGLDVTQAPAALFGEDDFRELEEVGGMGLLAANMYREAPKPTPVHDPATVVYLIEPGIFRFRRLYVDIEVCGRISSGETIADLREELPEWLREGAPAEVCVSMDGERYKEVLKGVLAAGGGER